MMKKLLISLFLFITFSSSSIAATINANSCSSSDVQSAINISSSGDTVMVPACSTTAWSSSVIIPATKAITVQGAGSIDSSGNYTGTGSYISLGTKSFIIRTAASSTAITRITGFYFYHADSGDTGGAIQFQGANGQYTTGGKTARVDHCYFKFNGTPRMTHPAIHVAGWSFGVVDHCTLYGSGRAIFVENYNTEWSGDYDSPGSGSWNTTKGGAVDWGGPTALYIENCWGYGNQAEWDYNDQFIDSRWGSRYVIRYNYIQDMEMQAHSGASNGGRSVLHTEIYNNTIVSTYSSSIDGGTNILYRPMLIRGGTGVIYNNTITGTTRAGASNNINIDYRPGPEYGCSAGWGLYVYPCTWPCYDQPGTTADATSSGRTTSPFYYWGNTYKGAAQLITEGVCGRATMESGRDYISGAKPGYTAYRYPHPLTGGAAPSDEIPPTLSTVSPLPTISCTSDPMTVTEQYSTNEAATVRWDTTDKSYDTMANTFTTTGGTTHSRTVSRACGASYTIYARGVDAAGNKNTASTALTYTIGDASPDPIIFIDGTKFGENSAATVQGVCTDAYLNEGAPTTNTSASQSLGFWTSPAAHGGHTNLIKFDLSSIPTTATVTAAKLYLSLTSYGGDESYEVTAHKVTGKAAVVSEVTWNNAATGLAWTAAGGLSDVAASESTEVVGTDLTWYEWSIPTMVSQWVATPATNYGVLLASDQTANTASLDSYRYFASSNKADATLRPILIVAYTTPDPGDPGTAAKTIKLTGGTLTISPSGGSLTITW